MSIFPAVVPEGDFPRAEVVAVRIARKVAPLFGVRWERQPFSRTWVSDFASLTLAEIARGAPLPARDGQVSAEGVSSAGSEAGQEGIGRAIASAEPVSSIANATLHRFGPHTKAAVVLTGVNRLLQDATVAISAVVQDLPRQNVSPETALAIWAGLTLEAFRGQPALVVAGIQARAIQRSLTVRWGSQVAYGDLGSTAARCEVGSQNTIPADNSLSPTTFDLVDVTLDALFESWPSPGVGHDQREDIAASWCRRLMQMGQPGAGLVWLTERDQHRQAHSYQRVGAMVAPFADGVFGPINGRGAKVGLPHWPTLDELNRLDDLTVRAHAVAAHVAVDHVRYTAKSLRSQSDLNAENREFIQMSAKFSKQRLGPEDPAVHLLTGYHNYLALSDMAAEKVSAGELQQSAVAVMEGQRRALAALSRGHIDPGAGSYLIEIGNIALFRARDQLAAVPGLDRSLERMWREVLRARGIDGDPAAQLAALNGAQIFHLSYFAQYLTMRGGTNDLRRALKILAAGAQVRDQVAAAEPATLLPKHVAGRDTHLAYAVAASELADREGVAHDRVLDQAVDHVRALLDNPSIVTLYQDGRKGSQAANSLRRAENAVRQTIQGPSETLNDWQREHLRQWLLAAAEQTDEDKSIPATDQFRRRIQDLLERIGNPKGRKPTDS